MPLAQHTPDIPFHKLTPEEQRASLSSEKAAVIDEHVTKFLDDWAKVTREYMLAGYRVSGIIVGGTPEQFRVDERKFEITSPDGVLVTGATDGQIAELLDAVRGGQVQIVLQRQWSTYVVDSETPVKVLHPATGKFLPFQGKFDLPILGTPVNSRLNRPRF